MNCQECGNLYKSISTLRRHQMEKHSSNQMMCEICGLIFSCRRRLVYHQTSHHNLSDVMINSHSIDGDVKVKRMKLNVNKSDDSKRDDDDNVEDSILCNICKVSVSKINLFNHNKSLTHKNNSLRKYNEEDENIQIVDSAFRSRIITYRVTDLPNEHIILTEFMNSLKDKINKLIQLQIDLHKALKVNFELYSLYTKYNSVDDDDQYVSSIRLFNTKNIIFTEGSDFNSLFSDIIRALNTQSEEVQEKESGWALEKILFIEININKYNPMRGSSYMPIPDNIKQKRAIINIENTDQACFAWSIMACKYPNVRHPERCSSYPHYSTELILDNITFPMCLKNISKFEELNNISINVYGIEQNQIVGPLYYTKCKKQTHANLLYIEDGVNNHYCFIKNFNALVGSQLSKRTNKKWVCDGCLIYFRTEDSLNQHLQYGCNKIKCTIPNEDNSLLKFKNIQNKERVPFIIYCDFEAILKPIDSCLPNINKSFNENIVKHEPCSFAYYIKCAYDDTISKFELYRGEDCGQIFVERLRVDLEMIYKELNFKKVMNTLTIEENLRYNTASACHMCEKPFIDWGNYKSERSLPSYWKVSRRSSCEM